jgi:hypothetical protein
MNVVDENIDRAWSLYMLLVLPVTGPWVSNTCA